MPRLTLHLITIALIGATLSACGQSSATPDLGRPTLGGWKAIGLTCSSPTKDNVPSGLLQWKCLGLLDGVEMSGVLDGDDKGAFSLQFVVPAANTSDDASDAFARLVDATPPLDGQAADIVAFIGGWPGIETTGSFGAARVRVSVDDIWRTVTIVPGPRHTA